MQAAYDGALAYLTACLSARGSMAQVRAAEKIWQGTDGSNPSPSSKESSAKLTSRLRPRQALWTRSSASPPEQVRMTAATFFAKTKMGWTERVVNKHAKKDGKPFLVDDGRQRLIEIHLCRGELDRDAWRLDRCPYPRLLGDWRGAEPAGAGQRQGRTESGPSCHSLVGPKDHSYRPRTRSLSRAAGHF